MTRNHWLLQLSQRWFRRPPRRNARHASPMSRRRVILTLEQLENRIVPTVNLLSNFNGIDQAHSFGYTPPDTQGAAGSNSYVETVNQSIAIYNKTGTNLAIDSLSNFWYSQGGLKQADAGSRLSDPVVGWDEQIQRFIVGDQDVDSFTHISNFDIAVSKTADPTTLTAADWNFFQVSTTESGYDADYPGNLGWNHDALVFTLNMFPVLNSNVTVHGSEALVFKGFVSVDERFGAQNGPRLCRNPLISCCSTRERLQLQLSCPGRFYQHQRIDRRHVSDARRQCLSD
jgi:hypothetical protein